MNAICDSFRRFFKLIIYSGDCMFRACERCVDTLATAFLVLVKQSCECFEESVCDISCAEEVASCR